MDNFTIFTWSLTALTMIGTFLNTRQNKYCFILWGLCNLAWIGVDWQKDIIAQSFLYCTHLAFNIYGWRQWGKKEKPV